MFHAQKRHWMGCAVSAAAMLADMTYDEVIDAKSDESVEGLRSPHALLGLLRRLTDVRWLPRSSWRPRPLDELFLPEAPVAAFLTDQAWWPRLGQWVVVNRGLVHDPEYPAACLLKRYPRRRWHVANLLEPADPARLAEANRRRRLASVARELAAACSETGASHPRQEEK